MNQKKKLKKYIYDTYQFDLYREELIHKYLCKEKLKRKQLRQLSANVKFEHYKNWKDYIIKKYSVCIKTV